MKVSPKVINKKTKKIWFFRETLKSLMFESERKLLRVKMVLLRKSQKILLGLSFKVRKKGSS